MVALVICVMPSDVRSPVSGAAQTAQDMKGCGIRTHVCCQSASRQEPQMHRRKKKCTHPVLQLHCCARRGLSGGPCQNLADKEAC